MGMAMLVAMLQADEVFSLENRKFQLQQSMEERKQEVTVHVDSLKTELRFVRDDIHRITLELKEREMKVRQPARPACALQRWLAA